MIKNQILLQVFALLILSSCGNSSIKVEKRQESTIDSAQYIVDKAIASHGFDKLNGREISFAFRDKAYTAKYSDDGSFQFTRSFQKGDSLFRDVLTNSGITRRIDDSLAELSEEWQTKYSSSVNSVIYFALLPYRLNDAAVVKEYLGSKNYAWKSYELVKIYFQEEGGGDDHEDEYVYWFNADNMKLDHFAYNYLVDGGGVRFRTAFEAIEVEAMIFNQYLNYSCEDLDVPIETLLDSFMLEKLQLLSQISKEEIEVK